jgi:hypothetical protein
MADLRPVAPCGPGEHRLSIAVILLLDIWQRGFRTRNYASAPATRPGHFCVPQQPAGGITHVPGILTPA